MLPNEPNSLTELECIAEFDRLFPNGFAGPDVMAEIAPNGWEKSPLSAVFHPSVEQLYEESLQFHRNLATLVPKNKQPTPQPEPTLAEIEKDYRPSPIDAETELRELVGQCLWDIFSDAHEVLAADGRLVDLGSFRASGGFLAEHLNRQIGEDRYDYLDFYMGTIWVARRADLSPVYRMIFRRLKARRQDWVYHFPQLHAVDLSPLREALKDKQQPEWADYSPEEALAKEREEEERQRELSKLREQLREGYREAVAEALKKPPPLIVQAYRAVYGEWPSGWPPVA